jgi:hypothetical protein
MDYTEELGTYIYHYLKRYNRALANYREDAMQEIRYAILVGGDTKEVLRLSGRLCSRLVRDYGWRRPEVLERYRAHCLSLQQANNYENTNI